LLSNKQVAECFTPSVYEANTTLFELPAVACRNLYIVVTGSVFARYETFNQKFRRVHAQRVLGPDASFGEHALFGGQAPDILKVRTRERSILLACRPETLMGLANPIDDHILQTMEDNFAKVGMGLEGV
jgi:CRP-like cAMP-binding protein